MIADGLEWECAAELGQDVLDVVDHGVDADAGFVRRLLIGMTGTDELQDVGFT